MAKLKTLSEAESARRHAVTGLHNLGRDDEADRYEGMDAREYAEEKGMEIVENPLRRRLVMAKVTKSIAELEDEIEALTSENDDLQESVEDLQGQLDDIAEIVSPEEEDDEDTEDDESDRP